LCLIRGLLTDNPIVEIGRGDWGMSETYGKGLNIAMFGQKRVPSREGGIEVVVEEIAPRMVAGGNKVTCYNRKRHLAAGEEFNKMRRSEYKGVRLKDVFTVDKRGLAAVSSSVMASIKASFGRYDVVHIHAEGPAFMCWLPKLFGKRVVTTIHGLDHERSKWGRFASAYIMMGERNAVRFSDEIIVLSQDTKKYFKDTYNRNTVFIPNGVDRPEIKEANIITEKFGLEKDSYILFLGRIVPEKGLKYLINAFKDVRTDKKLVIAGASGDTDRFVCELKEMSKSDDRIIFTGFVEGEELEEMFSNAYIYTLPSDLEGMPISLLEAMSYGNCCLTSDISECADVIEDYGITFKKGDVWSLREKLQWLCDSPEIVAEYKSKAADFICDKYSWDVTVDKTLELYKR
jgi:glycosyltransferase involved in cell wall biosynthesis